MRRRGMPDLAAGLLAIAVLSAIVYLGFTKGRVPFLESPYEVKAVFTSAASQVGKGSPVRIAGVEVGRVSRVERGPGNTALITMRIKDSGRPLHRDATMKIRPRLFLEGNFFVDVRPGTPAAPELEDDATIPLAQTAIPVQFDDVLDVLQADTRSDLQATVRQLARGLDGGGAAALARTGKDLPAALSNTAVVAEAARGERPGDLTRFVEGTGRVAEAVASREQDLRGLLDGLAVTTSTLAARRGDVDASLVALASTMRTARGDLAAIGTALPPVRRLASALEPGLKAAGGAIDDLRPFVRNAGGLAGASELPALTASLRPVARRLSAIAPGLSSLLTELRPIARCVDRNVLPVLESKVDDGALSTNQPVWQELAHLAPGLATAASTFDGSGYGIRYYVGGGPDSLATALPGATDLVALTDQPILGARPRWTPGQEPPFDAKAPCEQQALPDLRADAAPAPRAARTKRLGAAEVRSSIRDGLDELVTLTSPAKTRRALGLPSRKAGR